MSADQIYLLDTSVIIRLLRRRPLEVLVARVRPLVEANVAAINDVVRAEVLIGCRTKPELRLVAGRIDALRMLRVTESTWNAAADLGFHLRRNGITASVPDLLIAASAIESSSVVMHVDGDFDKIAKRSDLRVESYSDAAN